MPTTTDHIATLATLVEGIRNPDDHLDRLGALRLVELQARSVRRALVIDAIEAGRSWDEIADTLAITVEEARQRYQV